MASTVWGLITQTNPNWDAVRVRIGTHPSEANCSITKPLYVAVGHDTSVPPPDVISALLKSHRRKCKLTDCDKLDILTEACYNSNMKGNIIKLLLEAFELKPSLEFIYRLIRDIMSLGATKSTTRTRTRTRSRNRSRAREHYSEHQERDNEDFCTVTALIQYWPTVLLTTDKNGNILLHHACNKGNMQIHLIATILDISIRNGYHMSIGARSSNTSREAQEEGVGGTDGTDGNMIHNHGGLMTMNRQKRTPLQNLCRIINDNDDERAIDKIILCSNLLCGHPNNMNMSMNNDNSSNYSNNLPILHNAISSVTQPRHFQQLVRILKNEGTQNVTTSCKDQYNRKLIQVAIASSSIKSNKHGKEILKILIHQPCNNSDENDDNNNNNNNNDVVTLASFRDEMNRLPLHYACELGLPWNSGLEDILDANINALEEIDEITCLFPFMLAATKSTAHTCFLPMEDVPTNSMSLSLSQAQRSFCDLSAIYGLLRKNPNILETIR